MSLRNRPVSQAHSFDTIRVIYFRSAADTVRSGAEGGVAAFTILNKIFC